MKFRQPRKKLGAVADGQLGQFFKDLSFAHGENLAWPGFSRKCRQGNDQGRTANGKTNSTRIADDCARWNDGREPRKSRLNLFHSFRVTRKTIRFMTYSGKNRQESGVDNGNKQNLSPLLIPDLPINNADQGGFRTNLGWFAMHLPLSVRFQTKLTTFPGELLMIPCQSVANSGKSWTNIGNKN